jgi:hypothetical protein
MFFSQHLQFYRYEGKSSLYHASKKNGETYANIIPSPTLSTWLNSEGD